jgi:hypothetical protein
VEENGTRFDRRSPCAVEGWILHHGPLPFRSASRDEGSVLDPWRGALGRAGEAHVVRMPVAVGGVAVDNRGAIGRDSDSPEGGQEAPDTFEAWSSPPSTASPVVRIDHAGEVGPIELLVRLKHGSLHCRYVAGEAAAEVHLNHSRIHARSLASVQVGLRDKDTGG